MKRFFLIFTLIIAASILLFAETAEIPVSAESKTGIPVPCRIYMHELLEMVGDDFDANWYSIRISNESGEELEFQIDDLDSNGKISSDDLLTFLFVKGAKIIIDSDPSMDLPEFTPVFAVENNGSEYLVTGLPLTKAVKIDDHGFANYKGYGDSDSLIYGELGILRVAGWKGSTYWINGSYGYKHEEKTSYNFRVKNVKLIGNGPIGATFLSLLESETFPGFNQKVVTTVLKTGEILVDSRAVFENYSDMMKLQLMSTKPLTDADQETVLHVLPLFRKMVWSEQLNSTPYEYWKSRNALKIVNSNPYIVFPAADSAAPLWWGAAYIFASEESWRANYSQNMGLGVYEVLPEKPVVYSDFGKFIMGNTWVYESREFRDGIFRWMPGEFEAYEPTKGIIATDSNEWPQHYKAGDEVVFVRLYGAHESDDVSELIDFLEMRSEEFQSVKK